MDLHVSLKGSRGLSEQIYRQVRAAIVSGRLQRGDRLPATRDLAGQLDVARNTVALAYAWLIAEGLATGKHGSGTFVAEEPSAPRPRRGVAIRHRSFWDGIAIPAPRVRAPFDFGVGTPDARLFPYDTWRRLVARQIRATKLSGAYGEAAGYRRLRRAIAHYVAAARGVHASADDVIITNGAQQAFDLIARVLLEPRMTVAVEDPGYPPARFLFASFGAHVVPTPVDEEGLDVASLPDDARVVYVTPSHQFPLGMAMSNPRRAALLAWAEKRNAVIIEDDYDSEFRFGGRPLDPLQAIDGSGRVIYVGSFSKILLPALRLGFLIAPPSLRHALAAASFAASGPPQLPAQGALASMIEEGTFVRHVRKVRREYAARHERIFTTLMRDFSALLDPISSVTGMHLAARLRRNDVRFEQRIFERAMQQGVAFDRLARYYVDQPHAGIVLGYGAIATNSIDEGLRRLKAAMRLHHASS